MKRVSLPARASNPKRRIRWGSVVAGCFLSAGAMWLSPDLSAQTLRTLTTSRQLRDERQLSAKVDFAGGSLRLGPGLPSKLYRMELSYDEGRFTPVSLFDEQSSQLELGLKRTEDGGRYAVSKRNLQQDASIELSPQVDLSLDAVLGAAEADLELGGLRLTDIQLNTGASRTSVRFSKPNTTRCSRAELTAGAAELEVAKLGNSRCQRVRVEGGVGEVTLDLSGAWPDNAQVMLRMVAGSLTLKLPRRVGIELVLDKFLASFEPDGFIRQGTTFHSHGYSQAQRRLRIDLETTVGGVKVEWLN